MAEDSATEAPVAPKKKSKLPLILGLVLALAGGGGGFYAVSSGLILGSHEPEEEEAKVAVPPLPDIGFVPIDPLVINIGDEAAKRHLRFSAQLEVDSAHLEEVRTLSPRILDVLNSYLRAVEVTEIEDPSALVRLRAQMLRRIQLVVGAGRVRDLLIVEFVVN